MIDYPVRQIVNVTRPGQPPQKGDDIEIETTGGWIREVDPRTRQCTDKRKRFRVGDDGLSLKP